MAVTAIFFSLLKIVRFELICINIVMTMNLHKRRAYSFGVYIPI